MRSGVSAWTVCLLLILLTAGCYTNLYVNFGNGTGGKISVKSSQTGQEVEIRPKQFRKLGHSSGSLVVSMPDRSRYEFVDVKVAAREMDSRYFDPKRTVLGAFRFDLDVMLATNMQLYVLLPGKKAVDEKLQQPTGYPKSGQKLAQ